MSEEARKDIVLIVIFSLVLAIGIASVFLGYRFLAWIAIVISDAYLFSVLLLAALRSDDNGFLRRHLWITRFFPRKTTGISIAALLFLAIVSGFAGLYVGAEVFPSARRRWMLFTSASSSWDSPTTRHRLAMVRL